MRDGKEPIGFHYDKDEAMASLQDHEATFSKYGYILDRYWHSLYTQPNNRTEIWKFEVPKKAT